ncbi:lipid II flippase MurJ [Caballeronia sp. LZ065]|uniref:murein biosynthesis integral membrane protein MurJ n=1 Tax=Caballeronia sp. LZ065 TaxID=3038571 RepID=UPI00286CE80F|nr:lipid II flippase MurJ [Caballeronia sp. LZ065]
MWVSAFALLAKCAGAFKEMAIAYRYGISNIVDAYQLSFTAISWLPTVFVTVLSVVLIPTLVGMHMKHKEERARFLGELDVMALVVGAALAALLYFAWPLALKLIGRNLSEETRTLSRQMMFWMWPIGILTLTVCIHAARLQARERHVNTFLESVPAICTLCLVLGWQTDRMSLPLVIGSTAGFFVQAFLLIMLSRKADGIRPHYRLGFTSPQWPKMGRAVGVFMIGQFIMALDTPLDQYFVAGLGDGGIATLGYANRIIALLVGMGAVAISRATLPVLSEMLSKGDHARARTIALKWSMVMTVIGVGVVVVAWALAPIGVALLFQRGAFTAADTQAVAGLFRWGLLQIPCYFGVLVLVQLLASEGRFRAMAWVAALNFIVKAGGNLIFIRWLGISGVMLATTLMCVCSYASYLYLTLSTRPASGNAGAS